MVVRLPEAVEHPLQVGELGRLVGPRRRTGRARASTATTVGKLARVETSASLSLTHVPIAALRSSAMAERRAFQDPTTCASPRRRT